MIKVYNFKLIKSGNEVEVYKYLTKNMVRGCKRRERLKEIKQKSDIEQLNMEKYKEELSKKKFRSEFSIARTRSTIRRIINANPQLKKFLTLTFAEPMTDLTKANRLFNLAIRRVVHGKPEFQYIAVVEFQKDVDYFGKIKPDGGSIHYHLLCSIKTILERDQFEWERWFAKRYWKNGFVKIEDVDEVDNLGAYFCKYLGKDMFDPRMFRRKKFFRSQTLNIPVEMTGYEARDFFDKHVKNLDPKFKNHFKTQWAGEVEYKAYTLGSKSNNYKKL